MDMVIYGDKNSIKYSNLIIDYKIMRLRFNMKITFFNNKLFPFLQIWSSAYYQFTSIKVDWIHRFVYVLYDNPSSSINGIEIFHANDDYTELTFINQLTFSNMKTISSINVNPLQG